MKKPRFLLFAFVLILCGTTYSSAQVLNKKSVSLELAKKIANAAEAEAAKNKLGMVISIVDEGSNLVYLERMDNAQLGSIDIATEKAKTSIFFKRSTKAYEEKVAGGNNAILSLKGVLPFEGGMPLIIDNEFIGAIGVSGGTPQQDGIVAKAGVDFLENTSKTVKTSSNKEASMKDQIISKHNEAEKYRPEHIALNVADPVAKAKWYVENLNMEIIRQGDAPTFTTFISDTGKHIMFELYHNESYPLFDAANINHMSIHFAFMVNDIENTKKKLIEAGAKLVEDITKTPAGDKVLMLRDPWGQPIQFVTRAKHMLNQ